MQDSKTRFDRWVNIAGVTLGSRVEVVKYYRRHWARYGLSVTPPRVEGGFLVEQPDSWSVKLSLLAAPADWYAKLEEVLTIMTNEDPTRKYGPLSNCLLNYAKTRHAAKNDGEEHKYVLLSEGSFSDPKHRRLMILLEEYGLGRVDSNIHLVAAPLLRSTHAGGRILTPMPFLATSTYSNLKRTFSKSFQYANPPGDPDPEFDLQGHAAPKLGNHSCRRYGDKVARDNKVFHALGPTEIDLFCGWNLAEISMDMQMKYAGQQRSERVKRNKLTMMG